MWCAYISLLVVTMLLGDAVAAISRVPDLSAYTVAPARTSTKPRTSTLPAATVNNAVPARAVTARAKTVRARSGKSQVIAEMSLSADMLKTCKTQYTECMDNFCNVLDDSQGRCSCSKNLKNYAATEVALKQATEELRDVAQKIGYIGLSADEITALFSQTEAEQVMSATSDNTQLKNDLERIKSLVVNIKSSAITVGDSNSGMNIDLSGLLNFSASNVGGDLLSMFNNTNGASSISNQRGEQLYKTASARCKASVLNTCATSGVDISLVSNVYDMEIDKHCVAYERGLTDKNKQMRSTIRNANTVLQKARLMVAQQKNVYDLRGCLGALDSCMRDNAVCGEDYERCLDPTGRYIVDGAVVIGSAIGDINVSDADTATMLRKKIGTIDAQGRAIGFCAPVMQKCQNYTMQKGKYDEDNALITEYISRTNKIITKNRDALIREYMAGCLDDVVSCLNTNRGTSGNMTNAVARRACYGVITTCKSATSKNLDSDEERWLQEVLGVPLSQDNNSSVDSNQRCESLVNNSPKEEFLLELPSSSDVVRVVANTDSSQCWTSQGDIVNILFDSTKQQCVLLVDAVDSEYYTETNTQIQMRWWKNMKCEVFGGVKTADSECTIPKQQTNIVEKISVSEKYCMLTPHANYYDNACRCDAGYEMIKLNYRQRPYLCVPASASNKAKQCWRSGMAYDSICNLCITNLTDDLLKPLDETSCHAIDGGWREDKYNGTTACDCDLQIYGSRCAGLLDPAKYRLEVYAIVDQGYCSKFNGVEINVGLYNCKISVNEWSWLKNMAGDMRLVQWVYPELTELECNRIFAGAYKTYQNDTCMLYGQSEMKYEYIIK